MNLINYGITLINELFYKRCHITENTALLLFFAFLWQLNMNKLDEPKQ